MKNCARIGLLCLIRSESANQVPIVVLQRKLEIDLESASDRCDHDLLDWVVAFLLKELRKPVMTP